MKLFKFATGTITTIIALWLGMWVLKILLALFSFIVGLLATVLGLAVALVKVLFVVLLVGFALALAYLVYSIFFKSKPEEPY